MSTRLSIFVSSTVRDFGPVRRDLRDWLRGRQIEVRESEDPEFPVAPALHSHDACLRAVEGCHLFLLLIGWRYGGLYQHGPKSITWKEWDTARELGVPVVALVLKEVNDEAVRLTQAKRQLGAHLSPLDPGVARFIDALRRPPEDNWVHLDWDGSFTHLKHVLMSRMNALFVAYQHPHRRLEQQAWRHRPYVLARQALDRAALRIRRDDGDRPGLAQQLLSLLEDSRLPLFDFRGTERHNFVLYRLEAGELKVFARASHAEITRHDRAWPVGMGHVGRAAERREVLVAPNLQDALWRGEYTSDAVNYRSAVCVPILAGTDMRGVFVITSSRVEHFRDPLQAEVLTADSVGSIITLTGVLD